MTSYEKGCGTLFYYYGHVLGVFNLYIDCGVFYQQTSDNILMCLAPLSPIIAFKLSSNACIQFIDNIFRQSTEQILLCWCLYDWCFTVYACFVDRLVFELVAHIWTGGFRTSESTSCWNHLMTTLYNIYCCNWMAKLPSVPLE